MSGAARPEYGLLHTSVVVGLAEVTDLDELPHRPLISAVTLAELSLGPLVARDDAALAARQATLQLTEASFDPLPFDAAAARAFDALIAATALANGLPLHTANVRDVTGIDGLDVREVRLVKS